MTNNSLKDYYVKLHTLYENAANILTGINQSLTSNASQVSVSLFDENNNITTVKLPSFLYIDNKLEQLETTVSNLFNMPHTGEAWFSNTGDMYKLELVRSNTAPLSPDLDTANITAGFNINTFIKDLVSPRTFVKVNINNLPSNIEEMFMKKIVLTNSSLYTQLLSMDINSYSEYVAALYNYKKGIDYEEYDSIIKLPIKEDKYTSSFSIKSIIKNGYYYEQSTNKLRYEIQLDTLEYTNTNDNSQIYTIMTGDYLCLGNEMCIYKVVNVDYTTTSITIEEYIGHIALQSVSENNQMILTKYNYDYSDYNYIEIPVEENQYIVVFLGTIYNGVKSQLSSALLFDLSTIYMTHEDGSYIRDVNGNIINYIDYYNQYCNNIGDLILGLIQSAYPQLSNYTSYQLKQLQDSTEIATVVSNTIDTETILSVVPINKHIYEDGVIDTIKNYHTQKTSIQSELSTLTENINVTNNTLLNTDWSQETELSQSSLQSQLQNYYSQRLILEKQLNAVINEINALTSSNSVGESTKYRVRGITNITELETYIKSITNSKVNLIGLEVEYKYKAISKSSTSVLNINNNIFSDWNRLNNIDRQRKLIFNEITNEFTLEFVNYDNTANIIKWNQIDIPINSSEDVVIRIRYKYNIGQPFVNIYTPWSDELTISFPSEYTDNVELTTIVSNNEEDVVSAKFTSKLINDGYEQHITNNIVANNQTFYHMPENIYSGFNTSENAMISLKDKLTDMCSEINNYRDLLTTEAQKKYAVYLEYDGKRIELHSNVTNKINLYNIDHISDYFIKKNMNLIIKNTGEIPINFYSILPGNIDTPLGACNNKDYYTNTIKNYYRVPIFIGEEITSQTLGQWIYFRENNIYTNESCLYNSNIQKQQDYIGQANDKKELININCAKEIFCKNNIQLGLANKQFETNEQQNNFGFIKLVNDNLNVEVFGNDENNVITNFDQLKYVDGTGQSNIVVYKYEDICGYLKSDANKTNLVKLNNETSINEFITSVNLNSGLSLINDFDGAFFYVNLNSNTEIITNGKEKGNLEIGAGESVTIPLCFEYFLNNIQSISKQLMFDLKPSLINNIANYIIELTANYDTSLEAIITSNNTHIIDDATDTI